MTLAPPSSSGPLVQVVRDLSAAEILSLASSPVALVAAPGARSVVVPVAATLQYKPGTVAFATSRAVVLTGTDFGASWWHSIAWDALAESIQAVLAPTSDFAAGSALTITAEGDPGARGPLLTTALSAGGAGYAPGNTGTVDGGTTLAGYVVDTVDGGGAVLTYHLSSAGQGYNVDTAVSTTVVTGGGDGNFAIDVLTVTPASNGTGRVIVEYYVMALA